MNSRTADPPVAVAQAGAAAASGHLIRIEGELRGCDTLEALWQHLADEPIALLPLAQGLVLQPGPTGAWRVVALSGMSQVQRDAPMLRWYESLVKTLWRETEAAHAPLAFTLPRFADADDPCTTEASLRELLWLPLADGPNALRGGWLLARAEPWDERQIAVARRLAQAYAHGASAILGRGRGASRWRPRSPKLVLAAVVVGALLACLPVSLTTIAPAEVAAQQPFVVSAPLAGVVGSILVQPGSLVQAGDPLVQLVDTALRSDFEVAQQKLEVARARMLRLQAAVDDPNARRELAVAESEASVAQAERAFAQAMLEKSVIRAPQPGVALFGDPRDWVGRPVAVGEAIMRVADPQLVEFRIRVPVPDAVNLREGAAVKVFLDAAPLDPIDARVLQAAYKAEPDAAGVPAFLVTARAVQPVEARLGLRGSARIEGGDVPLAYFLLRRPIIALRQWSGI